MNEQLILKYQNNFARLIQDEYCLGDKMYDFENYEDLDDFKFKDYLYHYIDGRNCRILDYVNKKICNRFRNRQDYF